MNDLHHSIQWDHPLDSGSLSRLDCSACRLVHDSILLEGFREGKRFRRNRYPRYETNRLGLSSPSTIGPNEPKENCI